jgi:DNA-binding XRE family transcriptional regulator
VNIVRNRVGLLVEAYERGSPSQVVSKPSPVLDPSFLGKRRDRLERVIAIVLAGTRNDLDVSQRELAARLGWTRNVIANLETRRRSLSLCDFLFIASALSVNPEIVLQRILRWEQAGFDEARRKCSSD